MIEQDIFNTVKTALENDATLSTYVEKIYDGMRGENDNFVPDSVQNYIVMEPIAAEESYVAGAENFPSSVGVPKTLVMTIGIIGVITAINTTGEDLSYVVGYGNVKGILDLDEDIKNALDDSDEVQKLSDAEAINITTNQFIQETFPKRKVVLALTITRNFLKGDR